MPERPFARGPRVDLGFRERLPYARHATGEAIVLDSGAVMSVIALDGLPCATASAEDLAARRDRLNGAWRNLADPRLALWLHLVRGPARLPALAPARSEFGRELDEACAGRLAAAGLRDCALYLTLLVRPDPAGRAWRRAGGAGDAGGASPLAALETFVRDALRLLAPWGPRRLGLLEGSGGLASEPLGLISGLATGTFDPVPLVQGHLGASASPARVVFGPEAIEIRDAGETRFAAMLGLRDYPAATRPGHWDGLLAAPFDFTLSQSFAFLSRPAAESLLGRKQNQMLSANDKACSQAAALTGAMDALASNAFAFGEHQVSLLVRADDPDRLSRTVADARARLADGGLVCAREDLALEAAFWAQFPGNFRWRPRPAAITTRNLAALASLHAPARGARAEGPWGPPFACFRTRDGAPFPFSLHVGDVGHAFICGPTGSGKTVLQAYLFARLEAAGARRVFIDKDRGAEIYIRASGGAYLTLRAGQPSGLAPLRRPGLDAAEQAFLADLLGRVASGGASLPPADARALETALAQLAPLPPEGRSLGALVSLLPQADPDGLAARLERWRAGEPLGWALDGEDDAGVFDAELLGIDVTEILDQPDARGPVVALLLRRIAEAADGRPLAVDVDEFWRALGDPAFADFARDGLKTWRKRNAALILATQSPSDALAAPIARTLIEQCPTKIFLPNPGARPEDYVEGFGLTAREFDWVRADMSPARREFLLRQGERSAVLSLDLEGEDDLIAILSGRAKTVALLEEIRAVRGEAYGDWRDAFHAMRRARP